MDDASSPSTYREFAPGPALRRHLVCLWAQAVGGPHAHEQPVLPDGCIDLLWIDDQPPMVVGPATRAMTALLPPNTVITGLRFRPGIAPALLRTPADRLLDAEVDLQALIGRSARSFQQPSSEARIADRLAAAEAALHQALPDLAPIDTLVTQATAWLAHHPGGRVADLARLTDLGGRQLQRRFIAALGYGPKTAQRILRLQHAVALAAEMPTLSLADIAVAGGYADQAHMTRDFGMLAGQTPTTVLGRAWSTLSPAGLFSGIHDQAA